MNYNYMQSESLIKKVTDIAWTLVIANKITFEIEYKKAIHFSIKEELYKFLRGRGSDQVELLKFCIELLVTKSTGKFVFVGEEWE